MKHDYNENSFFVTVNKVSISEATVRVSLCLVHSTCSIVYHLGLFKYTQSGSLISVRKRTFFVTFLDYVSLYPLCILYNCSSSKRLPCVPPLKKYL